MEKTIRCPYCSWSRTFEHDPHPYKEYADPFHSRGKKMWWSHLYYKHRPEWQGIIDEKWFANNCLANLEKDTFGWTSLLDTTSSGDAYYIPIVKKEDVITLNQEERGGVAVV